MYYRVFFWIFVFLFLGFTQAIFASIHTYAEHSTLKQGNWTKISVSSTGFYKLTFDDLNKMGISNPQNVRVCGYGGAQLPEDFSKPFIDDLPENAIYIGNNYIVFYAQGPLNWQYNLSQKRFVHTTNCYSNNGYYFITQGSTPAKRIVTDAVDTTTSTVTADYFLDRGLHELDLINLANSGREFYGETFSYTTSYSFPFTFANTDTRRNSFICTDVVANAANNSSFTTTINSKYVGTISVPAISSQYDYAEEGKGSFSFIPSTDNLTVELNYNKSTSVATGYLNWIEMNVYRRLTMTNNLMFFRNPDFLNTIQVPRFTISNTGKNVVIWNITDPQNIKKIPTLREDSTLSFVSSVSNQSIQEFVAIDTTQMASLSSPEIVATNVPNQDLHALTAQDMIIISPDAFVNEAEQLAQVHRDHDQLKVMVVTPEQVYNEFSSGTPDVTAYRKIMKMLYDRYGGNTATSPKYLLLFGRSCFDNRGIIPTADPIRQLLDFESYNSVSQTSSYVSDDYLGFLDDNSGVNLNSDQLCIGVGRFPIYTASQAQAAVNKAIQYINNTNTGYWKNQLCFVADFGNDNLFTAQADSIASYTAKINPYENINKIYLDSFQEVTSATGVTYPTAKDKLLNLIQSGVLMLNYTGHGGTSGWSNAKVLTTNDILSMYNQNLALWVTATCDFTRCDYTALTAGEDVFLNPNGGGIALFTTTRTVFADGNYAINKNFANNVFFQDASGNSLRLGDMMLRTKNAMPGDDNKMSFILIGDPALKLAFPAPNYTVIIDSINHHSVTTVDTLNALSTLTINGHVNKPNTQNTVCTDFNGIVQAIVFDKIEQITTLGNDGSTPFVYYDRPNTLFSGKATVKSGLFSVQSIIPKDINYNFGTGSMNFYAVDSIGPEEGQGIFTNFVVGGTNNQIVWETNGPAINMYLNTPQFRNGDKVNETPLFIANVSDSTGINTIGSGIGHDITLILDQDPNNYYILDDYFEPNIGDYRSGTVQYKLPTLTNGKHTLTFKIWDVLNNSSDSTINFEVQKGLSPDIYRVYNYPNPVVGESTNFVLKHDRPDNILVIKISVYDLTGCLLNVIQQSTIVSSSTTVIPWNVTDANGVRLKPGIYLYKFDISTENSLVSSKTQKVMISK
jgi:hypothetical protein